MAMKKEFPAEDVYGTKRTPYAIVCEGPFDIPNSGCGLVYLTEEQYNRQMMYPDRTWRCPHCERALNLLGENTCLKNPSAALRRGRESNDGN